MFKIKTPSDIYNGVTAGVRFEDGIGETDVKAVRDELVDDFGYEDVTEKKEKAAEDKPARKHSAK